MAEALWFSQLLSKIDLQSPQLKALATSLCGSSQLATTKNTYDYVKQAIRYTPEARGQDHWQLPTETLQLKLGDCEDMGCLTASLLTLQNIPNALLIVMNPTWSQLHVLNVAKIPRLAPLLLDTTIPTAFGQVPYANTVTVIGFYPLAPIIPYLSLFQIPLTSFMKVLQLGSYPLDLVPETK